MTILERLMTFSDDDLLLLLKIVSENKNKDARWVAFSNSRLKGALEGEYSIRKSDFLISNGVEAIARQVVSTYDKPTMSDVVTFREKVRLQISRIPKTTSRPAPVTKVRSVGETTSKEPGDLSFGTKAFLAVIVLLYATWSIVSDDDDLKGGSNIQCYADGRCVSRESHDRLMESNKKKYKDIEDAINRSR